MKEILITLRNIFLSCFFIGFLFFVLAAALYMPCRCVIANFYQYGLGISQIAYYNLWIGFVGLIKTILIFLFLVPALAIHWTVWRWEKKHKQENKE